ncbi:hypothetical protein Tco_0439887 [Tanacetum coccineum]
MGASYNLRVIPGTMYHDLYLGRKALLERERISTHLGEVFESDRARVPQVPEKYETDAVWHSELYLVFLSGVKRSLGTQSRKIRNWIFSKLFQDIFWKNNQNPPGNIFRVPAGPFHRIPLFPLGAFHPSIIYSFDISLPLHHMSFKSQSVGDAVVPKFDMHTYTSTLTANHVKSLVEEYAIPLDLHPRVPPSVLTRNNLPTDKIVAASMS